MVVLFFSSRGSEECGWFCFHKMRELGGSQQLYPWLGFLGVGDYQNHFGPKLATSFLHLGFLGVGVLNQFRAEID